MDISKLKDVLAAEPKYRWAQVNKALWRDFISSWEEASVLSKPLREKLEKECSLGISAEIFSGDNKRGAKALITLVDGEKIETVLIKQKGAGGESARNTICLSSQAGCPLKCSFCATGTGGFRRNLKSSEIIEQAVFWGRYLKNIGQEEKIDNIVFMGMGEPFLNYVEFIKALKFLNNPEAFNIGARRISVSTVGLPDGIKRLAGENLQVNLAISLHASNDDLRRKLMPVAARHSLHDVLRSADDYARKTGRRIMFEYLMIDGVNDREEDALALVGLMDNPLYFVNLIPYNQTGSFLPSSRETINHFRDFLMKRGLAATIRLNFGSEIGAACGQLEGGQRRDLLQSQKSAGARARVGGIKKKKGWA